jgi:hypothetical protein
MNARSSAADGFRVSVAMCTYESERYLGDQLESIAAQTHQPDELVVCDDGSSDGTVRMLERFGASVPFPTRLSVNGTRLGFVKNFEKAISLCSGDVIFLSDADDVWAPEKIARMTEEFRRDPRVGAVFSDADVVDEQLRPLGYSVWERWAFPPARQRLVGRKGALPTLLKHNVVSGMALAFKSEFRRLVLPIDERWFHDGWIILLISAVAPVTLVHEKLVRYRQHEKQRIGAVKRSLPQLIMEKRREGADDCLRLAEQYEAAADRLTTMLESFPGCDPAIRRISAKVRHLHTRANARNGAIWLVARDAIRLDYHRYSEGWRSMVSDSLLARNGRESTRQARG